jgi:hypothetical protein
MQHQEHFAASLVAGADLLAGYAAHGTGKPGGKCVHETRLCQPRSDQNTGFQQPARVGFASVVQHVALSGDKQSSR